MNILDMDASTLADNIRMGHVTSLEAVEAYIAHITVINPLIHALIEDRFDQAREEARQADESLAQHHIYGRLHGVPMSMKEAYHMKGMKTTGGLRHRKHLTMSEDAAVVHHLKAEGAIILGKTNTPTLCFYQETENKLYGRTNNPWNLLRTAGGSSGGEGALIAAGGAAAGMGSDIGGSIRFPAHFNGVVAFKSGDQQVEQKGNFPYVTERMQERMLGMGPMTKTVADSKLLYNIIAKHGLREQTMTDFTITILPKMQKYPLSTVTESLLQSLKTYLSTFLHVQQGVPPLFRQSAELWQEMMAADGGERIANIAFSGESVNRWRAYSQEWLTGTTDWSRYLLWVLIGTQLFKPNQQRIKDIQKTLDYGDHLLDNYLDKRMLIFPVYDQGAPKHGRLFKQLFSVKKSYLTYMPYVAYANTWGLPALTLPVGEDEDGQPLAIQIISKTGNETAMFELGSYIEAAFRGYQRARVLDYTHV